MKKKLKNDIDSQDKTMLEEYLESRKKALESKLNKPSEADVETLIVFCKKCWEIIETSGG